MPEYSLPPPDSEAERAAQREVRRILWEELTDCLNGTVFYIPKQLYASVESALASDVDPYKSLACQTVPTPGDTCTVNGKTGRAYTNRHYLLAQCNALTNALATIIQTYNDQRSEAGFSYLKALSRDERKARLDTVATSLLHAKEAQKEAKSIDVTCTIFDWPMDPRAADTYIAYSSVKDLLRPEDVAALEKWGGTAQEVAEKRAKAHDEEITSE